MPIYEYRCNDCGVDFEKLVLRSADRTNLRCPSCGEGHLMQRLSPFAAHSSGGRDGMEMCPSGGVCPTPGLCGKN